jgi:2,3-bisphosphoglycerate-independent phosphoglycerate mutase
LREGKFPGEDDLIVPSPSVATYDKKPEMSAYKVLNQFKKNLYRDLYHFIVINFANPDMVGHSGSVSATTTALEVVDKIVGVIVNETLKIQGAVFITADHGNAEELLTYPTGTFFYTTSGGNINTEHSNNPVPFYVISKNFEVVGKNLPKGSLSDVTPTILSYMGIPAASEMTGSNLLKELFVQSTAEKTV